MAKKVGPPFFWEKFFFSFPLGFAFFPKKLTLFFFTFAHLNKNFPSGPKNPPGGGIISGSGNWAPPSKFCPEKRAKKKTQRQNGPRGKNMKKKKKGAVFFRAPPPIWAPQKKAPPWEKKGFFPEVLPGPIIRKKETPKKGPAKKTPPKN